MELPPFVHKFQSLKGNYYIYDVKTNQIIRVDKIVYDIIEDLGVLSNTELISKWQPKYQLDSVKKH